MSQVFVQTEECYRKEQRFWRSLNPFFPIGPNVEEITAGQLMDVLNSAAKDGPDRHYVVMKERNQ